MEKWGKMDTKHHEKRVGLFVLGGLAVILFCIFVIGKNRSIFSSTYELKVAFDQVQGISPGSVVQLIGVNVGNVDRIEFTKDNTSLVVVLEIEKSFQNRITEGSKAGVRTQGALGDKFVYITPGPSTGAPMKNDSYLATESGGDLFSTISEKSKDINSVFEIIHDLRQMVKDINGNGEMKTVVQNLKNTSEKLSATADAAEIFMKDTTRNQSGKELRESVAKLNAILTKIDDGTGTLGALINDPALYQSLSRVVGNSQQSSLKNVVRESIRKAEQK
jgi:phospholipid/cholesterol/gamma-HCH transport system substrate-binding protein